MKKQLAYLDQGGATSALKKQLAYLDQGGAASALKKQLAHLDQIGGAASANMESLRAATAPALEASLGDLRIAAVSALEADLGDLRAAASANMESLQTAAVSALEANLDGLRGAAPALAKQLAHLDQGGAASALKKQLADLDQIGGVAFANMESLMKLEQDWQKQVNFLSKTQASLGFPDIIRSGLSADPFRISTPTQRRTPLVEPSPTANTSEVYEEVSPEIIPALSAELVPIASHAKVFIVHGHDHPARDTIAKFVNNLGLTAIILDKEPDKGRTIIEKFEDLADEAGFAIVLLTPDDVGGLASAKHMGELKPRARQNVMWEWGYFCKAIGRQQVCLLCKGKVELPSDTHGLLYIPMDDAGKWQQKIIREMVEAQVLANANKI